MSTIALFLLGTLTSAAAPSEEPVIAGTVEVQDAHGAVHQLPMARTEAEVHLDGDLATVHLSQVFDNPGLSGAHALYTFPLPANAAVYAMKLVVGDEVVQAHIARKDEAREEFEAAKASGQKAALLEQQRPNVFTQEIANLDPGESVTVELSYAHAVPREDGRYAFHLPMVVGPRYTPASGPADGEPLPGQWSVAQTPALAPPAEIDPSRVGLSITLDPGGPLRRLESPSHPLEVHSLGDGLLDVGLSEGRVLGNRDFVLEYTLAHPDQVSVGTTAWAEGGRGVVSLLVEPPTGLQPDRITPREVVFLLDCSGSMSGAPMEANKRFMRQALRDMRPEDHFRIVRFSESASSFRQGPVQATPANVAAALEYVDGLHGMGGTEMREGIRAALDPTVPEGAMRVVVFLTDGYIGNDAEIVSLVEQRRGDARIFALGIGSSVNRWLIEEVARVGHGSAQVVLDPDQAEEAADQLAEHIEAPVLTDVSIDWRDAPVREATPDPLPDLFTGQPLRVLARFDEPGSYEVAIHGRIAGQEAVMPVLLELPEEAPDSRALAQVWARSQVHDRMAAYLAPTRSVKHREQLQEEVTVLGLEYGLVTQWTSFVAVSRQVAESGDAQLAQVATPQAAGVPQQAYGGGQTFGGAAAPEPVSWAAGLLLLGLGGGVLRKRKRRADS